MSVPSDLQPQSGQVPRRYELLMKLASGGMATVYLGYQRGGLGFRQLVAIKRLHAHLLDDPAFRRAILKEATLASRIRHANVVAVRDVDAGDDSVDLVLEYVQGTSLASLMQASERCGPLPIDVALRIAVDACAGLHAAHDVTDDRGGPLGLVHRDVAPQNILLGEDGVARVADFGIAKCVLTADPSTWQGTLKGRLAYMAPEYLSGLPIDRRADVFALGVVVWEMVEGVRLFRADTDPETMANVLLAQVPPLNRPGEPAASELHAVILRALDKERDSRFASMRELSDALELVASRHQIPLSHARVAACLQERCGDELRSREAQLRARLEERPSLTPDSRQVTTLPDLPAAVGEGTPTTRAVAGGLDEQPATETVVSQPRRALLWLVLGLALAVVLVILAFVLAARN